MSELLSEIVIYYSLGEEVKLSHVCFVYGQVTEKIAKDLLLSWNSEAVYESFSLVNLR
ncbi:MAG: hypothetical protein VYD54_12215 [Bdellovibrionota bacterium]|nr:hypothetical protein [Bdellovibrionota bacterium]